MNPFRKIKSYIDDNLRLKVTPIPGSVVYTDLDGEFEYSGIIGTDGEIITLREINSNSTSVKKVSIEDFIAESENKKVYVSSNFIGAVGNKSVALGAEKHIGDVDMYRCTFENSHSFTQKCLYYSTKKVGFLEKLNLADIAINIGTNYVFPYIKGKKVLEKGYYFIKKGKEYYDKGKKCYEILEKNSEIQLAPLKKTAKEKIGATKWLLWNLERESENLDNNIDREIESYKNIRLSEENIQEIKRQEEEIRRYLAEIEDENIDKRYLEKLLKILDIFKKMQEKYEEVKDIIEVMGGGFSLNELEKVDLKELNEIVKEMENNREIKKLVEKIGRDIKSDEEDIKITKVRNHNMREEVYGVKKGDDIARLLSSELASLSDEDMEYIFYIKLYEKGLLNYSLSGMEEKIEKIEKKATKGPIVVALDTSGSMLGESLTKGKALLLSIFNTLQREKRKMYILLFSDANQIREKDFDYLDDRGKLLSFINSGFGGGTNFDTPLKRGIEILKSSPKYEKADILMITDGECTASEDIKSEIKKEKLNLKFNIYSVITIKNHKKESDGFSDEIINI